MRRVALVVATAALVTAVVQADAARHGFVDGVAAGEITSTSAVVWTRAPAAGPLRLNVALTPAGTPLIAISGRASAQSDLTVSSAVRKLQPGTSYAYWFVQGEAKSAVGTFRTAPNQRANAPIRFAISGDADATAGSNGKPGFNTYGVYARMAAERNDFNINLGDTIYSDSEIGGAPAARTVAEKWGKYRLGLALPALRRLRASAGLYSHWDDHEFVNDFSRAENGDPIYAAGVAAFTD